METKNCFTQTCFNGSSKKPGWDVMDVKSIYKLNLLVYK
jgi:hypothetical protein